MAEDWEGSIRRCEPGDEAALARLRWEWRTLEHDEKGLSLGEFTVAFAEWVDRHRGSHLAWLAEQDGEAIGMAWLAITDGVPGPQVWDRPAGVVQSVYVTASRRNSGVGAALVNAVVSGAAKMGLRYLEVHPSERSFPFYRRLGFSNAKRTLRLGLARPT